MFFCYNFLNHYLNPSIKSFKLLCKNAKLSIIFIEYSFSGIRNFNILNFTVFCPRHDICILGIFENISNI